MRMERILERFIRYVKIDTQSDPAQTGCPSTPGQLALARMIEADLKKIGMQDVTLDAHGYVTATLPANTSKTLPVVGFIAHMDTSPDFSGKDVNPRIHAYTGGPVWLDPDGHFILDPAMFPELDQLRGKTLITTDGRTLLGADDKAGITEIMEAMNHLITHPEIPHGTIKVAFTPDEEIGRGADRFPVTAFGADFAYTMDGGPVGELEYENFNAASAELVISGLNVHPGTAKNKMINAMQVGIDFHASLPPSQRPERTAGYEGFFHLIAFTGSVEQATLEYIIRDHDRQLFQDKKDLILDLAHRFNRQYKKEIIRVTLKDQYYNMREMIEPVMHTVDLAREAMIELGIEPLIKPIRGGTDGAKLSYMGLPAPNLFTGGYNYHGRYEFIPLESMKLAAELIVRIVAKIAG